jgi:hypothetical protein
MNPTLGVAAAVIDAGTSYGLRRQLRRIVD